MLGATFKENVLDIRNTRVVDIVRELEDFGITVQLDRADGDRSREYGLVTPFETLKPADAVSGCRSSYYRDGGRSLIEGPLQPGGGRCPRCSTVLRRGGHPLAPRGRAMNRAVA